jgi:hypothetical protein
MFTFSFIMFVLLLPIAISIFCTKDERNRAHLIYSTSVLLVPAVSSLGVVLAEEYSFAPLDESLIWFIKSQFVLIPVTAFIARKKTKTHEVTASILFAFFSATILFIPGMILFSIPAYFGFYIYLFSICIGLGGRARDGKTLSKSYLKRAFPLVLMIGTTLYFIRKLVGNLSETCRKLVGNLSETSLLLVTIRCHYFQSKVYWK